MSVRRTAAALIGAALLLAGCSDDPEPRFEPTPSPSPTESKTTTEPEAQTPEEFIREWVETYNAFEDTGDATDLAALGAGCGTCADIIEVVASAYADGGFVRSEGWAFEGPLRERYSSPLAAGLEATVQVAPSRYKATADSDVERGTGGPVLMEFDLRRVKGAWRMADLTRSSS